MYVFRVCCEEESTSNLNQLVVGYITCLCLDRSSISGAERKRTI